MRFSEIIIIYLAVGAPFCVQHFFKRGSGAMRALPLLKATGAMLIWPLELCRDLLARRSATTGKNFHESAAAARTLDRIEEAKGGLLAALYRIQELAREDSPAQAACTGLEQETRDIGEKIEKYVGLTLAAAALDVNGPPDQSELELCRIAGRTGEDLLLAGLCIHRRNAAQVVSHQSRSRTELLHALATVREFGRHARVSPTAQPLRAQALAAQALAAQALKARYLSVAVLKFYGHAVNLLSLLEDESAAVCVARLLNAECARLRRLESGGSQAAAAEDAAEGEVCTNRRISETDTQPVIQSVSQPVMQPATQPTTQPVSQPLSQAQTLMPG